MMIALVLAQRLSRSGTRLRNGISGLAMPPNDPLIAADLSPENKNRSAGNGMLAKIAGRNVTRQVMKN